MFRLARWMGIDDGRFIIIRNISVVILAGIIFYFIYYPRVREVKRLSMELETLHSDISGFYNSIGGRSNLNENIIKIKNSINVLNEVFPPEREISRIIKEITDKADDFKIDVVSITPGDIETYRDNTGKEINLGGDICKYLPLHINLEAPYRPLGEFLIYMEGHKRPFVSVSEIDIYKDETIMPRLKIDMKMHIYLTGK